MFCLCFAYLHCRLVEKRLEWCDIPHCHCYLSNTLYIPNDPQPCIAVFPENDSSFVVLG